MVDKNVRDTWEIDAKLVCKLTTCRSEADRAARRSHLPTRSGTASSRRRLGRCVGCLESTLKPASRAQNCTSCCSMRLALSKWH